ncbi:hypothetical protein XENTR_v10004570 [Xenopus tropicalis]|nr:hypothetical protein XENTR_v10004570 [Xenopus tropicalis]
MEVAPPPYLPCWQSPRLLGRKRKERLKAPPHSLSFSAADVTGGGARQQIPALRHVTCPGWGGGDRSCGLLPFISFSYTDAFPFTFHSHPTHLPHLHCTAGQEGNMASGGGDLLCSLLPLAPFLSTHRTPQ